MKVAVYGAGGSWGSRTLGVQSFMKKTYDLVIGVSTGALMALFLALGMYEEVIGFYTSVNQSDIFSLNPYNRKGKISFFRWRMLQFLSPSWMPWSKPNLGESKSLRKLIDIAITKEMFVESLKKEVMVGVYNKTKKKVEYKSNKYCTFEDFKDFIWYSANAFPVMSIGKKGGCQYEDGGTAELLPIKKAIEMGATEVDVFVHRTHAEIWDERNDPDVENGIQNLESFVISQRLEIEREDIKKGLSAAKAAKALVTIFYLDKKLSKNSLIFDEEKMNSWVIDGYTRAENGGLGAFTYDYR